ncbi:aldo/keto reductase [Olsenella profusa]|uniref:aldo/keto reductase n=1 Tax=Olsenella profusa TaxID=138595 RepID=UPI003D15D022
MRCGVTSRARSSVCGPIGWTSTTCTESAARGIGFVAFSPIASGLLSGKVTERTQFERYDDVHTWVPQLSRRNIRGNRPIVELVERFAARKHATPAQISQAWMLAKYPCVVPIPGSKNKERIIENLDAAQVELTDEEFRELDDELGRLHVYGHRGFSR